MAKYCQKTDMNNSIGSPGMIYMCPPWHYGAAAQYVPVHPQQQNNNLNTNHGNTFTGYNRQISCWICGGNHRSDACDQKHKLTQDQINQKVQEGIQRDILSKPRKQGKFPKCKHCGGTTHSKHSCWELEENALNRPQNWKSWKTIDTIKINNGMPQYVPKNIEVGNTFQNNKAQVELEEESIDSSS